MILGENQKVYHLLNWELESCYKEDIFALLVVVIAVYTFKSEPSEIVNRILINSSVITKQTQQNNLHELHLMAIYNDIRIRYMTWIKRSVFSDKSFL